jgi:CMP-N,N'-diacetyllegionaminic acid synthase
MKVVTIIPARGGSKGIPRKNLITLRGKPLISYAISASIASNVHETWVSSEDNEILSVASAAGAKTIRRPDELATDTASSEGVLLHFAAQVDFDILVFLQATSPLIIPEDINRGLLLMQKYDSIVSVTENNQFTWTGGIPNYDPYNRKRRQELEQSYLETGSMFITKKSALISSENRISGQVGLLEVPRNRSFDIDTYDDLEIIKALINE